MPSAPSLLQSLLAYRVDAVVLLVLAIAAARAGQRYAARHRAGRNLASRIWLVALAPVAMGSILAEWVVVALAYPELSSLATVIFGRLALLGAFGAVSALLLVDTVQLAVLRAELRANDDARQSDQTKNISGQSVGPVQAAAHSLEQDPGGVADSAAGLRRPRILVVDDMETNRCLMEIFLRQNGFEPDVASGGREAIQLATANHYDAILMDLQMPDMDGCTAAREIRSREASGRRTPIVALTATVAKGTRERCLAAGMDEHFAKPLDLPRFKELLRRLCNPNSGGAPAA
jgi:CheY-like chemotaxis protein